MKYLWVAQDRQVSLCWWEDTSVCYEFCYCDENNISYCGGLTLAGSKTPTHSFPAGWRENCTDSRGSEQFNE